MACFFWDSVGGEGGRRGRGEVISLFRQRSLARGTFDLAMLVVAAVASGTTRFFAGAALEQQKRAGISQRGGKVCENVISMKARCLDALRQARKWQERRGVMFYEVFIKHVRIRFLVDRLVTCV